MVVQRTTGKAGYTNEEFKYFAKGLFGDRYSYDRVDYKNRRSMITLVCSKHGEFVIRANSILGGRKTTPCKGCHADQWVDDFVTRALEAHGDSYDYSMVVYPEGNQDYPVDLICYKHGSFTTNAYSHVQGRAGCPECHSENNRLGLEAFLAKAHAVHENRYDYSDVVYVHGRKPVSIRCKIHGAFEQKPDVHLMGSGCQECFTERFRLTTEQFIERARAVHGDRYCYSKVVYRDSKTKVDVVCQTHGKFAITPNAHIACKQGCPRCKESKGESRIRQFLEKHGIEFIQEYKLGDSRFRYDFFLPSYSVLIEFQGHQHFKPVAVFGGVEGLRETRARDYLKQQLAKKAGMYLSRPTYHRLKEDRLERYLERILRARGHVFDPRKTITSETNVRVMQ